MKGRLAFGALLLGLLGIGFFLGRVSAPSRRAAPPPAKKAAWPRLRPSAVLKGLPKGHGKIAIVLDDWGYNLRQVPMLSEIRKPLTVSVLPNLPFSSEVAQAAHSHGHEVILHMPMEAQDSRAPREKGTLLTRMPKEEVLRLLEQSLATVPFAQGISNHQGSKATADRSLMEVVMGDIKRRGLFFLDSMVTEGSVCRQVAGRLHLRFAQRAIFLDNDKSPEAIRGRLIELAKAAVKSGRAVGIGHDRGGTLQLLQDWVPALEQAGYELVPASELAEVP